MTRAAVLLFLYHPVGNGAIYVNETARVGRADNFNGASTHTHTHKVVEEAPRRSPIHPALVPETDKTVDTP